MYNTEDGGEKVLCAIDDDTRFENVLVRDRYVLIFEKMIAMINIRRML